MTKSFRKTVRDNPVASIVVAVGTCAVAYDFLRKYLGPNSDPHRGLASHNHKAEKITTQEQSTPAPPQPVANNPKSRPEADDTSLRTFTTAELAAYKGSDPSKPLLLGVDGLVFDVSPGRDFYGPEGPYNTFAGCDATRALALVKVSSDLCNLSNPKEGLTEEDLQTLEDWIKKFKTKYELVGRLAPC